MIFDARLKRNSEEMIVTQTHGVIKAAMKNAKLILMTQVGMRLARGGEGALNEEL